LGRLKSRHRRKPRARKTLIERVLVHLADEDCVTYIATILWKEEVANGAAPCQVKLASEPRDERPF
jgi:hypothetical protein